MKNVIFIFMFSWYFHGTNEGNVNRYSRVELLLTFWLLITFLEAISISPEALLLAIILLVSQYFLVLLSVT